MMRTLIVKMEGHVNAIINVVVLMDGVAIFVPVSEYMV